VKKGVFEWISTGQKTVEFKRGKGKHHDDALSQFGRKILRRDIFKRGEGSLTDVLRLNNHEKRHSFCSEFRRGGNIRQKTLWNN
jgi:hypothetical protein